MRLIKDNVERVAEDAAKIAKLKADGYKEISGVVPKEVVSETEDLAAMTVDQLKDLAREKGKKGVSGLAKEELLEILKDVV